MSSTKHNTRPAMTVRMLDTDKVTAVAAEVHAAQYGSGLAIGEAVPLVYGIRPGTGPEYRRMVVICEEGVGWTPDDRNLVTIPVFDRAGMDSLAIDVSTYRLLRECATDEEVNLADFIRTFGDRLERNYSIQYNLLTTPRD